MRRLVLKSFQSPGDILMLTAAVRELHTGCPGQFQTDVRTSADALWENNPHVTPLGEGTDGVETLDMHYPLIHQCNGRPYHFIHGYAQFLEQQLGVRIPLTEFRGEVHLTDQEKEELRVGGGDIPERFWILVGGGKYDFTAKWWNPASYQQVVDHFHGRICFVQCGEAGHWHPPLEGVVNLVGKTSLREFVQLMYHADGVLCPVTLAMHLAAAVETKPGRPKHRACVVVAGGREPTHWEAYPHHQFLSTNGMLSCCADGGCWRSRCQTVGDGDQKDRRNVCVMPEQVTPELKIPRCMQMITPQDVIRRIELYHEGDAYRYRNGSPATVNVAKPTHRDIKPIGQERDRMTTSAPVQERPTTQDSTAAQTVLIKFSHGLGDAVQLTTALQHLRHYHPNWEIDVAALMGKHSSFHGLARNVFVLERDHIDRADYDKVLDLEWPESPKCYAKWPSSKAERCLLEVFGLTPIPELCTYKINISPNAIELARRYLEKNCALTAGRDGRYPAVQIHYEGNTSRGEKDLPVEIVRRLCGDILDCGAVPVILDWDRRSPLPDGERIHNPNRDLELWGGTGTGDAEVLAALTEMSALAIGVDSGPLHVAGATSTQTIGIWTEHHPLHYFGLADNVIHLVPEDHRRLLRGERDVGDGYFQKFYRHQPYKHLENSLRAALQERLNETEGGLVKTRGFWIRTNNAEQDLVVVQDIAEEDSYGIAEIPMASPVVVDVGAHIGCFAKKLNERNPLARIIAVECCPENMRVLEKNVGHIATVVQGAVTYDREVALLNAVFPHCVTTGGSTLISRKELQRRVDAEKLPKAASAGVAADYWADFRPIKTLTLEDLMEQHQLDHIDVLKLDCEGSEFSILEHTPSLDRVGIIVGEYHGKDRFFQLVERRFKDWELRILQDGELGTFWLKNPREISAKAGAPRPAETATRKLTTRFLVAAMKNKPDVSHSILLMEDGQIVAEYEHADGWLRGFTEFAGKLWTIDSFGRLFNVLVDQDSVTLEKVSESPLAREAHDLAVSDGRLVTAGPKQSAVVFYDPVSGRWSAKRPWVTVGQTDAGGGTPDEGDQHHVNSVLPDGDGFLLSFFSAAPKPPERRWRDSRLDEGTIIHWGPNGFAEKPLATGIYGPHSLRRYQGHVWWCESFRHRVFRDDGWKSPDLVGFARGLSFVDGKCVVGLSRSRVDPFPFGEICGVCVLDPQNPESREIYELDLPFIEVYDVIVLEEP